MEFFRQLLYVQQETEEGPRLVSRFYNLVEDITRTIIVSTFGDSDVERGIDVDVEEEDEGEEREGEVNEEGSEGGEEAEEVSEGEEEFDSTEYEEVLNKIDEVLSDLNFFLQVPETQLGETPNGTVLKKKEGTLTLIRRTSTQAVKVKLYPELLKIKIKVQN